MTRAQLAEVARRVTVTVAQEVAEYPPEADSEVGQDIAEGRLHTAEFYFRTMSQNRTPVFQEANALVEATARRRVHQGLPLEALLRAIRVGTRVMWECLLEHAPDADLGRLGILTLGYLDIMSTATERAYSEEREQLLQSIQEATRLLLERITSGELADEAELQRESRLLGYDLSRIHAAILIAPVSEPRGRRSGVDLELAKVATELRRWIPNSPSCLLREGLLFAIAGSSVTEMATWVRSAIQSTDGSGLRLSAGIGTPRPGGSGLMLSFQEAQRARALGAILNPAGVVHSYHGVRFFDLFKQGESIDAFVEQVLSPLIKHDTEHRRHLIETLDAFFSTGMHRKAAAKQLGIHPNTLDYRLGQAEELLGASMSSSEFSFRFQLAMKLLPLSKQAWMLRPDST